MESKFATSRLQINFTAILSGWLYRFIPPPNKKSQNEKQKYHTVGEAPTSI